MTLSGALEQDHAEIDRGIDSFGSGRATGEGGSPELLGALDRLRRHIYFEEVLLFPPLREAGLVPPLFVMCREHGEIWAAMDALSAALGSGPDASVLADLVGRLTALLQEHNTKEEMIVYPAAHQMIAAPTLEVLGSRFVEVRMPDGWVCDAARRPT